MALLLLCRRYCESNFYYYFRGDFSVSPATLSVNSSTGAIDLTTGTVGAFYNITYTTPDGPCQNSSTITISINANDDSTFAYLDYIYCAVGSAMPSSITTSGGAFSISPSGLSINSTTGALTLGGSTPELTRLLIQHLQDFAAVPPHIPLL